ncbi:Ribulose-5-phosphate 4-epimerase/Fuculose-1-phosphate aldolase [Xaviernesmea oryzae]|uniref:3-oxo-tetronate 4-phosphate decarboxylase n=1 Tax=Xaviernesmea oryzae TaxID=464029 RepID=A0A1X7E1J8_9HYPH|nr:3-oxo-tetronate 4-phosphate decarboxylase [Xaviernesmea oryzae]SMF25482.1 Ribulose-5-phosphate 4-epimerase/Fuculose-1-phosphate aldolase [Xaviernesmea oryzae]
MTAEQKSREKIVRIGGQLYQRQLAHGSAGNLSIRLEDGSILVTPTNSSLGFLEPARISRVSPAGELISGDPPSKEAFFHLAVYEARPSAGAVVHLHSTYSVAISCLCHEQDEDVLPPLTAYQVMRVGKLPLLKYFRPGDRALAEAVRQSSRTNSAMLLANHGPVVSGKTIEEAMYAYEELEEAAKLFFLIGERKANPLTAQAIAEINKFFPN